MPFGYFFHMDSEIRSSLELSEYQESLHVQCCIAHAGTSCCLSIEVTHLISRVNYADDGLQDFIPK